MTREASGFFDVDVDEQLAELSAKDDDLEWLTVLVDFELFRSWGRQFPATTVRGAAGRLSITCSCSRF